MSTTEGAFITPEVARWARERLGETLESTAKRISVKPQRLASWEEGTDYPNLRQARNLAKKLYIPFGYLFLSSPPEESSSIPLPDFRTISPHDKSEASPEFMDLFHDVLFKQEWYREYLRQEGSPILEYVGRFSVESPIDDVSADISETIDVNNTLRRDSVSWADFLRRMILRCEGVGVLVMKSGVVANNNKRKLSVEEFRGFAISDSLAPVVFINSTDALSAQIFTLVHELAHIWIGMGGTSNPNLREKSSLQTNPVERFCNMVAAEVLVPRNAFLEHWQRNSSLNDNLQQLAAYFRVSTMVVLRRAYDLNRIGTDEYLRRFDQEEVRETKHGTDGGNFYAIVRSRNSRALTEAVVQGAVGGTILFRDAARLLNVKVPTVEKLYAKMVERA
jgi:Zn-dependent peptidase ImmA (M78 family)/DNA-binding XRE family transcriptional regulator